MDPIAIKRRRDQLHKEFENGPRIARPDREKSKGTPQRNDTRGKEKRIRHNVRRERKRKNGLYSYVRVRRMGKEIRI